jgi:putative ABC transport system permease protein
MKGLLIERTLTLGLKSLWRHRLRSLLTVLGVVFGVCSVIAMLAVGEGASYEAQEQIRQLGSTNIVIRAVNPQDRMRIIPTTGPRILAYGITYDDAERIAATIPSVEVTVPIRQIAAEASVEGRRTNVMMAGTVPWFPRITNRPVAQGRFLTRTDLFYANNVCVLERGVAAALFPVESPIGRNIRVGGDYYCVVGVMAPASKRMQTSGKSSDENAGSEVYIPFTTSRKWLGEAVFMPFSPNERVEIHELDVRVSSVDKVIETAGICREMLARSHRSLDYEVIVPLELLRAAERTKRIYNIVLGSVAAISLLVGGIGIMNIMLASVTERTREIGIRRALGAKKRHIIVQFLTEAVLLSGAGGLFGVAVGIVAPFLVEYFARMKTIVTLWSVLVAFSISVAVGIIFGLYPASRAANMDPVEALRHE